VRVFNHSEGKERETKGNHRVEDNVLMRRLAVKHKPLETGNRRKTTGIKRVKTGGNYVE